MASIEYSGSEDQAFPGAAYALSGPAQIERLSDRGNDPREFGPVAAGARGLRAWRDRGFPRCDRSPGSCDPACLRVEFGCPKLFRTVRCSASIRVEHRTGCIGSTSRGERTRGEAQPGRQLRPASLAGLRRPQWPY
jgi:hypothetical protein